MDPPTTASLAHEEREGTLVVRLGGRLDVTSAGGIQRQLTRLLAARPPRPVELDASELVYLDAAGTAVLTELRRGQEQRQQPFTVTGLEPKLASLLTLFAGAIGEVAPVAAAPPFPVRVGRATVEFLRQLHELITFVGALSLILARAALRPASVRWREVASIVERAGTDAMALVALIGMLFGLVLAFQAAIPLQRFGAEIYVVDLVALSMVRELGAILTAVVFAGRTGSAFAAEIGTMKVNEEVNALETMGIDPVRFLVVPRVLAGTLITPILSVVMILAGLFGSWIVLRSLGYQTAVFEQHVLATVSVGDFLGGLFKAVIFGLEVATIGCLQGLRTGTGATAVGASTTAAVVMSIVVITVTDGVFAVLFFLLGL